MAARIDIREFDGNPQRPEAANGFTLIEMAVAVFIISLLL